MNYTNTILYSAFQKTLYSMGLKTKRQNVFSGGEENGPERNHKRKDENDQNALH